MQNTVLVLKKLKLKKYFSFFSYCQQADKHQRCTMYNYDKENNYFKHFKCVRAILAASYHRAPEGYKVCVRVQCAYSSTYCT